MNSMPPSMNSMPPMLLHPMNGLPHLRMHEQKVLSEIPTRRRVNETAQREFERDMPPPCRVTMDLPGYNVKRKAETKDHLEQREIKRARVGQNESSARSSARNTLIPRQTFDGFRTKEERDRAFLTVMTYDNDYPAWFNSFRQFIQAYPIPEQEAVAENMVTMIHKIKDNYVCHNGINIYFSVHAIFMNIDNINYRRDKYKKEIVKKTKIMTSIENITSQENGDWAIIIFPDQKYSCADPIIKIKNDASLQEVLQKLRSVPRNLDMVISFWKKA
jgi:hypothetical protein